MAKASKEFVIVRMRKRKMGMKRSEIFYMMIM
jgi:hypothetical protein